MSNKLAIFTVLALMGLILPSATGLALNNTSHQPDYLINPGFEEATPSWYLENEDNSAIMAFTHDDFDIKDGLVSAVVHVTKPQEAWQVQLKQQDLTLAAGYYQVSFYAKTSQPAKAVLVLDQQVEPWANYGLWYDFETNQEWEQYRTTFMLDNNVNDARLSFYLGQDAATYFLDDIQITKIDMPMERTKDNLILNSDFEYPALGQWLWEDVDQSADFTQTDGDSKSGINSVKITINDLPNREQDATRIQFYQGNIPFEKLKSYQLTFSAKMKGENIFCPLGIKIMKNESPWTSIGYENQLVIGYDWQDFKEEIFTADGTDNARLVFLLGKCRGDILIDNIKLKPAY
ncbi:MAG: carbohydrate binding domain-containing protein [bacterium]